MSERKNNRVEIDCKKIVDWESFHDVFSKAFGFPEFYGRNMDAWNDCMTELDTPADKRMSRIGCESGGVMTIELLNVRDFRTNHSELYYAIIECSSFVNWRRIEKGLEPVLCLSFWT